MPIVTAANHRFARTLHQMLASAERQALPASHQFTVIDLGMREADRAHIARRFPWCRIEPFDFGAYPAHVRDLSNFAWKPCLIWEWVQRSDGAVLWFDAAMLFHGGLDAMLDGVEHDAIFSLAGQTALADCCDPRTLARLDPSPDDVQRPYRAGGVLGFDPQNAFVRDLVRRWRDLAADASCIAPAGLDRRVHRFDQAILTALLYHAQREHGLRIGQDEIDISSTAPVDWISSRNKVAPWVPTSCDEVARTYFWAWKRVDRLGLRIKRDGVVRGIAETVERAGQRFLKRSRAGRMASLRVVDKTAFRGRACHCEPRLSIHLLHSEALREAADLVVEEDSNVEHSDRPHVPVRALAAIADQVTPGDVIHVKSDLLPAFVRHVLPRISAGFVLVTGDSDVSPVNAHAHLLDDTRVLHWFAQNCDRACDHPRLTRIPIGIDNPVYTKLDKRIGFLAAMMIGRIPFDPTLSRNGMGDQAMLQRVKARLRRRVHEKPARVLCTFHRNSVLMANADTIPDRREAAEALTDSPDCHFIEHRLGQEAYWLTHDDFAFELSPRGNGLDCFRTWECLYLDTIPIVKTSPLDALYEREQFPVVIVESYREVTAANLRRWQRDFADRFDERLQRSLTVDYWLSQITARRGAASYQHACSR